MEEIKSQEQTGVQSEKKFLYCFVFWVYLIVVFPIETPTVLGIMPLLQDVIRVETGEPLCPGWLSVRCHDRGSCSLLYVLQSGIAETIMAPGAGCNTI